MQLFLPPKNEVNSGLGMLQAIPAYLVKPRNCVIRFYILSDIPEYNQISFYQLIQFEVFRVLTGLLQDHIHFGCSSIPAFSGGGLELSPTALVPLGCGNDDGQGKP